MQLNQNNLELQCLENGQLNNEILKQYTEYILKTENKISGTCIAFLKIFDKSLGEIHVGKFTEFTFNTQYTFISKLNFSHRYVIGLIYELKLFYIYLINNIDSEVFSKDSGLNYDYLLRVDFNELYKKGYKIIYFNKIDKIPIFDQWLIKQNGYENISTAIRKEQLMPLDFARVKEKKFRYKIKEYVFYSNYSMKTIHNSINNIFKFFEFIESDDIKKIKHNIYKINNFKDNGDIEVNDVLLFIQKLQESNFSQHTISGYIQNVKDILSYLKDSNFNINNKVFELLKTRKAKSLSSKTILDEDYKVIAEKIKQNALEGDYIDKLIWIYVYLLSTTKFRPSEILNLNRNCIDEGMKIGDKIIKLISKSSNGEIIEENPSEYTIRSLQVAIDITAEIINNLSDNAIKNSSNDDKKNYIFIKLERRDIIKEISSDFMYRRFKKMVSELDLKGGPYTVYNYRSTYMTTIFEQAVKEGKLYKAVIAGGHKDYITDLKYYVKPNIKSYLEAFYKVQIGNVNIMGKIIDSKEEMNLNINNENIVKNGCGVCYANCKINENIDCLICRNMITTPERIPYFRECIKKIDEKICKETILHEKEHLVSIKKLYVAYIAAIYSFMERVNLQVKI